MHSSLCNEKLDNGKIIVKKEFYINTNDDENTFKEKDTGSWNIKLFQKQLSAFLGIFNFKKKSISFFLHFQ